MQISNVANEKRNYYQLRRQKPQEQIQKFFWKIVQKLATWSLTSGCLLGSYHGYTWIKEECPDSITMLFIFYMSLVVLFNTDRVTKNYIPNQTE